MRDPTLQATALRFAASDLSPAEATAFAARLADDQDARDALAEAVRLSAAALGQDPPAPHRSFRAAIRERLLGCCPSWLSRRAYRGHPFVWAALGAAAVAACTVIGLALADRQPPREPTPSAAAHATPPPAAVAAAVAPEPQLVTPAVAAADTPSRELEPAAFAASWGDEPAARSVAEIWADLSTTDHVERMHDDELRWRDKLRGIGVLSPTRSGN
jgi:hypothetical protein